MVQTSRNMNVHVDLLGCSQNRSQNSNFELFGKKDQIIGLPCCSTREDLSIYVSITNVGLIEKKLG